MKNLKFFYQIERYSNNKIFSHELNKSPKLITNQCHVIKEPNKKNKIKNQSINNPKN